MKKLFNNKVSFILLIFIIIWTAIILITRAIPALNYEFRLIESIKYEIIGGYASKCFIQRKVVGNIFYNMVYTLSFTFILVFSVITIFIPKTIKAVGITLIAQVITLLSLDMWYRFLADELRDTVLIDIKLYIGITILITIAFTLLSFKQNKFYLILGIVTLLQCFYTINLVKEYIGSINNIQIIFQCFSEIVIPILYWMIILLRKKNHSNADSL